MKKNLFFCLFASFPTIAQQELPNLCDTTFTIKWKPQYYNYNTKYPISSEILTANINKKLVFYPDSVNGYITIRFIVNCVGETNNFEVFQTDNFYQPTLFDQLYVEQFLSFVKSLTQWKIAIYRDGKTKLSYYGYFTFKIEKGIVTETIP
jgi:hypothetical protein